MTRIVLFLSTTLLLALGCNTNEHADNAEEESPGVGMVVVQYPADPTPLTGECERDTTAQQLECSFSLPEVYYPLAPITGVLVNFNAAREGAGHSPVSISLETADGTSPSDLIINATMEGWPAAYIRGARDTHLLVVAYPLQVQIVAYEGGGHEELDHSQITERLVNPRDVPTDQMPMLVQRQDCDIPPGDLAGTSRVHCSLW